MAELLAVKATELQDVFYDAGWTDGLPVVAPTQDLVDGMLVGGGAAADDLLGSIPSHGVSMSAEHAAIAAVMAGCRPEYFPVVLAALGAVLDEAFNLPVACTSTGGSAICVVVSGPLAAEIGMNALHNALASGNRANATIGRAVRLAATNLLRTRIDGIDGTSLGHPGKVTFCFAERPPTAWPTLTESLGYAADDTTVTVLPAGGPLQVANHLNASAEGVAASLAAALRVPSHFTAGKGGAQFAVVLGPEHEAAFADAGWSRRDVQRALRERSAVTAQDLTDAGIVLEVGSHHDMVPDARGRLETVADEDDLYVVTAGGAGAGWSAVVPSWAPKKHAQVVTRRVRRADEGLPPCGPDGCVIDWDALEARM
jgi:hypothetical protein